jgi:hypothetical protein
MNKEINCLYPMVYMVWENYFDRCEYWKNMISIHATQSGAELEATRLELEHVESGSDRELARDCRDLLAFDQQSRQVIKNLTRSGPVVNGLPLSETVRNFVLRGMKINAIKELRTETNCGLKEAKDAVEAWERSL